MSDFFQHDEILTVLQGFNPWWANRPFPVPDFLRIPYYTCKENLDNPELKRAIILSGPRRVGKTTILYQTAQSLVKEGFDSKAILYLSLDHPLLKLLTVPKILKIYHQDVYPEGKKAYLLLDEVQYSKGWETQVKLLIDQHPEYRILATGSASMVHHQGLSESGVGRWMTVPVPTLSFYEFAMIQKHVEAPQPAPDLRLSSLFTQRDSDLKLLGSSFRMLMPLFQRYLLVGGFPETARITDLNLCQRLLREDVVERVLKRDMTALFGVRNVADLEKLFIYLCLNSGGILSVKTCADALQTTPITVDNHLKLLEQAHLIYRLPPDETGGKKILKMKNKIYLVDAALRNAVLLKGEEILNNPTEMGKIVETTVLRHLYAYHYPERPKFTYWWDANTKKEVDIILKTPNYTIAVEVKYRSEATLSTKDGIFDYCQKEKVSHIYWVTRDEADFDILHFEGMEPAVLRIPAHIFTYLLGQTERLIKGNIARSS